MTLKLFGLSRSLVARAGWLAIATTVGPAALAAQSDSVQQRLAAIKQSLGESQQRSRQYQWIETTAVSLNGEEKSREQKRCYYGADGTLQKVPVSAPAPAPAKGKPGLRGKAAANKKAELTDYMQSAVALMKTYIPPDPAKLQASKQAGKASVDQVEPGKRVRVNFRDYAKPGDTLGVALGMADKRLLGLTVASYLADPKDVVQLDGRLGMLDDGTTYPQQTTLNAPAKHMVITVVNSGYQKVSP